MDAADLDDSGVGLDEQDAAAKPVEESADRKEEAGAGDFAVADPLAKLGAAAKRAARCAFRVASSALWILASSTFLLCGPMMLEVECARMEKMSRQARKYVPPHSD